MATRFTPSATAQAVWPPDDTEESVVGTNRHQMVITNLRIGINEIAAGLTDPGQSAPWHALSQTMITGLSRPDGTPYSVLPDLFVYRHAIDPDRGSLRLRTEGPPILAIEVASESTYPADVNTQRGKAWSYAHAGIREYLVLDPLGEFLDEPGRGWRLEGGVYVPWQPDAQGRWPSAEFPMAFAIEEEMVTVFGPGDQRQFREGEITRALRQRDAELARRLEEMARQRAEMARKDTELAEKDDEIARQREEMARKDAELEELRRRLHGDA